MSPASKIWRGALPALALGCFSAQGQTVLVPAVQISDQTPSVDVASSNWVGSANAPVLRRPTGAQTYPLEYGPLRFHPHLGYQIMWADGLLTGTNTASTFLHTVTPGLFVGLGEHWNLDFSAAINRYSSSRFSDNSGFYLGLSGLVPLENWIWTFGYAGARSEETQVETGTQIQQWSHLATVSGNYFINARLGLELNAIEDIRVADSSRQQEFISDYYTSSTLEWLNFRATSRTTFGLGAGGGYTSVSGSGAPGAGVDWLFEQAKGRVVWLPGRKLSFQLSGGGQWLQFNAHGADDTIVPVYDGSVVYQLFEPTVLAFSARQEVENAYQEDRYAESTVIQFTVRQRLFHEFYLSVQPAYNIRSYRATIGDHPRLQKDRYCSVYSGVTARLFKKLDLTAFYLYGKNHSSENTLEFESDQAGFRFDYRY